MNEIGLACFRDEALADELSISLDTDNQQLLGSTYHSLVEVLSNQVIVHHGSFDRDSLKKVAKLYNQPVINADWVDSTKVVRQVWPEFRRSGYNLKNITGVIGYEFTHHVALEDAKAAGYVMLHAINKSGIPIDGFID